MDPRRNARTRQQTLTQIDFVRHLIPNDELDLDFITPQRYTSHRRGVGRPAPAPTKKRKRGHSNAENNENELQGRQDLHGPQPLTTIKRERPTPDIYPHGRGRILRNSSSAQTNAATPDERVRVPLEERTANDGVRGSARRSTKGFNKTKIESKAIAVETEQEDEQTEPSALEVAVQPEKRHNRPPRKRKATDQPATPHPMPGRSLFESTKTEVRDSEGSSSESEGEQAPETKSYKYGQETQAIIHSMKLTPEDLRLQQQFLNSEERHSATPKAKEEQAFTPQSADVIPIDPLDAKSTFQRRSNLSDEQQRLPSNDADDPTPPSFGSLLEFPEVAIAERASHEDLPRSAAAKEDSLPLMPSRSSGSHVERTFSQPTTTDITQSPLRSSRCQLEKSNSQATSTDVLHSSPPPPFSDIGTQSFRFSIPRPPMLSLSSTSEEDSLHRPRRWRGSHNPTNSQLASDSLIESIPAPPPFTQESEEDL
ncbi:MAG: hypothetical protein M4579_002229 [Chaenotheca gracillima]|nr:MAG: hypothetical protein M4579_002229 [Chaenotheca gracillima]